MIRFAQRLICRASEPIGQLLLAAGVALMLLLPVLHIASAALGITLALGLLLIGLLAMLLRRGMRFPHGRAGDAAAALTFSRGVAVDHDLLLQPRREAVLVCAPFEPKPQPALSRDSSSLLLSMAVSLLLPVLPKADEAALRRLLSLCHVQPERMIGHFEPEIVQRDGGFRIVCIRENGMRRSFAVAAPDEMIQRCTAAALGRDVQPLTEEKRRRVLQTMRRLAALQRDDAAPRAYAFAMRENEGDWIYLGLVGTALPQNLAAQQQLRSLQSAGYAVVVLDGREQPMDGYALPPAADADDLLRVTEAALDKPYLLQTDARAPFGDDIIRAQHGWRMRALYFLQAAALLPIVLIGLWLTRLHPLSFLPLLQWLWLALPRLRARKWDTALSRRGQLRVALLSLAMLPIALVCLWFGLRSGVTVSIAALLVVQNLAVGGLAFALRKGQAWVAPLLAAFGAAGGLVLGSADVACWFAVFAGALVALAAATVPKRNAA